MLLSTAMRPASRAGSCEATSAIASGSQMRIVSVMSIGAPSGRLDQEVQGHAPDAHDHQGHVVAHEAGLGAPNGRRGSPYDPGGRAGDAAADHGALQDRLGEAPYP